MAKKYCCNRTKSLCSYDEVVCIFKCSLLEEHCGFLGLTFASYPKNELLSYVKYNRFMSDKKIGLNVVDGETLCVLFPEFLLYNKLEVAARPWFIDDDGELWTRADGPNAPENYFLKLVEPPIGQDWVMVPSSQVTFVKC